MFRVILTTCFIVTPYTIIETRLTRGHSRQQTRLMALCPGQPGWASTRKVKPIWILLKQETVSGHGISWAMCKSASCSREISTQPLVFFQTRCPSYRPTNSVNALNAFTYYIMQKSFLHCWIVSALLTDLVKHWRKTQLLLWYIS